MASKFNISNKNPHLKEFILHYETMLLGTAPYFAYLPTYLPTYHQHPKMVISISTISRDQLPRGEVSLYN